MGTRTLAGRCLPSIRAPSLPGRGSHAWEGTPFTLSCGGARKARRWALKRGGRTKAGQGGPDASQPGGAVPEDTSSGPRAAAAWGVARNSLAAGGGGGRAGGAQLNGGLCVLDAFGALGER